MFWNRSKNNKTTITTTITRTSSEYEHEKRVMNEVEKNAMTCPHCGYISINNYNPFGYRYECSNIKGYHSECPKCGTQWQTEYEL